jgi:SAM-dependent methyltransferase
VSHSLVDEYRRQHAWRSWSAAYGHLGDLRGASILDAGCGPGDQAADLTARGAAVLGMDMDASLLEAARARGIPGARFVQADIADPASYRGVSVDGVWVSFAAAYLPRIAGPLALWARALRRGGWLAITEVDDLFGHEPLSPAHRARILSYYRDAAEQGRHQFRSRDRLREALHPGWTIEIEDELPDAELAFDGPAAPEVLAAWTARLDRMRLLAAHFGGDWDDFRAELLAALASPAHRSLATVWFLLARPRVHSGA